MKKKLTVILALVLILTGIGLYTYYDASHLAANRFKVTYLDVEDTKIPESFDGIRILYITDMQYGAFFNKDSLDKLAETIRQQDYDILFFGGDLFDSSYTPVSDDVSLLTTTLQSLDCRLGKFAIFGDHDLITDGRRNITSKILSDAGFEFISSQKKIYNRSYDYIYFHGYDFQEDISDSFDTEHFNLAFVHGVSQAKHLNDCQLIISGHSHLRQINLPFKDAPSLGKKGNLYLSNGIGETGTRIRLFSDPQILIIRLSTKQTAN